LDVLEIEYPMLPWIFPNRRGSEEANCGLLANSLGLTVDELADVLVVILGLPQRSGLSESTDKVVGVHGVYPRRMWPFKRTVSR